MCCGRFCLDGEVIFNHSKQVNKIGSSSLSLGLTWRRWTTVSRPCCCVRIGSWPDRADTGQCVAGQVTGLEEMDHRPGARYVSRGCRCVLIGSWPDRADTG